MGREREPLATLVYDPHQPAAAIEFLRRAWNELRTLRKVRVWTDRMRVYDVNGDSFEVTGVGYPDEAVEPLLRAVHATFSPETIHQPFHRPYKEFLTGRRYPWAEDRVM